MIRVSSYMRDGKRIESYTRAGQQGFKRQVTLKHKPPVINAAPKRKKSKPHETTRQRFARLEKKATKNVNLMLQGEKSVSQAKQDVGRLKKVTDEIGRRPRSRKQRSISPAVARARATIEAAKGAKIPKYKRGDEVEVKTKHGAQIGNISRVNASGGTIYVDLNKQGNRPNIVVVSPEDVKPYVQTAPKTTERDARSEHISTPKPAGAGRLLLRDLDTGEERVVDARQIRELLQDDLIDETVVLVGGSGKQYAANAADWEKVKHKSRFHKADVKTTDTTEAPKDAHEETKFTPKDAPLKIKMAGAAYDYLTMNTDYLQHADPAIGKAFAESKTRRMGKGYQHDLILTVEQAEDVASMLGSYVDVLRSMSSEERAGEGMSGYVKTIERIRNAIKTVKTEGPRDAREEAVSTPKLKPGDDITKPELRKVERRAGSRSYEILDAREVYVKGVKVGEIQKRRGYEEVMESARIRSGVRRSTGVNWHFATEESLKKRSAYSPFRSRYASSIKEALKDLREALDEEAVKAAPAASARDAKEEAKQTPKLPAIGSYGVRVSGGEVFAQKEPSRGGRPVRSGEVRIGSVTKAGNKHWRVRDVKGVDIGQAFKTEKEALKGLIEDAKTMEQRARERVKTLDKKNQPKDAREEAVQTPKPKTLKVMIAGLEFTRRTEQDYTHVSYVRGEPRWHKSEVSARKRAGQSGVVSAVVNEEPRAAAREPDKQFLVKTDWGEQIVFASDINEARKKVAATGRRVTQVTKVKVPENAPPKRNDIKSADLSDKPRDSNEERKADPYEYVVYSKGKKSGNLQRIGTFKDPREAKAEVKKLRSLDQYRLYSYTVTKQFRN